MSRDYCVGWTHWFDYDPKKIEDSKTVLKTFGKSFKSFKPTFADFTWTIKKQAVVKSFDEVGSELEKICTEDNDDKKTANLSIRSLIRINAYQDNQVFIEARSIGRNQYYFSIYAKPNRHGDEFLDFSNFKRAIKNLEVQNFKATPLDSFYTGRKRIALNSFEDICLELERIKAEKKPDWIVASAYGKTKLLVNEKEQGIFHAITIALRPMVYQTKESLGVQIEIVNPVFFNDPVSAEKNCAEFNESYKKFREEIPLTINFFNVDSDWSKNTFVPTTKEGFFDLEQVDKVDYSQIKEIIEKKKWKKEEFGEWEKL